MRRTISTSLLPILLLLQSVLLLAHGGLPASTLPIPEGLAEGVRSIDHEGLRYAVVTTEDLSPQFEPLAEWRSQMGCRAEIFTTDGSEGILEGTGKDGAEKLYNFIRQLYFSTNGTLEYVLLGGDWDLVPIRYLHAGASYIGLDDGYLSDVYYSAPTFDWDQDGDGLYGELEDIEMGGVENLTFPLRVGRVPVGNSSEASTHIERLLRYERAPPMGEWLETMIMASSVMDRPNLDNDPVTPTDEGYDAYKDNGIKAIRETSRYIPGSITRVDLHDYSVPPPYHGGNYSLSNDTLTLSSLPENLSRGCAYLTFAGQSYYDDSSSPFSLAQWLEPSGTQYPPAAGFGPCLTRDDIDDLENGYKLPLVYASSCDSFNFTDPEDEDLESLLYAGGGGAIAVVGSTGISWRGEGEGFSMGNWYLMPLFWKGMMDDPEPASVLYDLKEQYLSSRWEELSSQEALLVGAYTYNYFGDPALKTWTGQPREMLLISEDPEVHSGGDTLEVGITDKGGTPLFDCLVSAYHDGEVFTARTGPDGKAEVATDFTGSGKGLLTVTGTGLLPLQMNLTVSEVLPDVGVGEGLTLTPSFLTEGKNASVSFKVESLAGGSAQDIEVHLMAGRVQSADPDLWPEPLSTREAELQPGLTTELTMVFEPLRSMDHITIGVKPLPGEMRLDNNLRVVALEVNARPHFLPQSDLDLYEDPPVPRIYDLSEMVFDPDNSSGELRFSLKDSPYQWVSIVETGHLRIDPPDNWTGRLTLELEVTDGLASDSRSLFLNVLPVNDPPTLIGIEGTYYATVDRPFSLSIVVLDVEGDAVRLSLHSDLANLTISGDAIRFVPYPGDEGTHELTINVSDTSGAFRVHRLTIVVRNASNSLFFMEPSLYLPDARVGEKYTYTIGIGGALADNAVFGVNTTLFDIDPSTGEISFTPDEDDAGEHWVQVTVTSGNWTIYRTFILEVEKRDWGDDVLPWVAGGLGVVILVLAVLMIALLVWPGRPMEQYGLEE